MVIAEGVTVIIEVFAFVFHVYCDAPLAARFTVPPGQTPGLLLMMLIAGVGTTVTVIGVSPDGAQVLLASAKKVTVPVLNGGVTNVDPFARLEPPDEVLYQLIVPVAVTLRVVVPPLHTIILAAVVTLIGLAAIEQSEKRARKPS